MLAWHPSIKLQECETEAECRPHRKKKYVTHCVHKYRPYVQDCLIQHIYSCPNVHAFWTSLQRPIHSSVVTGETLILGCGFGWGWEPHNVIPPYISSLKTKILYQVSCMCWSLLYLRLQLRFILVPIAWYVAQFTLKKSQTHCAWILLEASHQWFIRSHSHSSCSHQHSLVRFRPDHFLGLWGRTHQMNLRDAIEGCVLMKFLKQPCMSTQWLISIRWPGKAGGCSDTHCLTHAMPAARLHISSRCMGYTSRCCDIIDSPNKSIMETARIAQPIPLANWIFHQLISHN